MAIVVTQSAGSTSGYGFGFTAVAGRILIAMVSIRGTGKTYTPGAWTVLNTQNGGSGPPSVILLARVAAGGETAVDSGFSAGNNIAAAVEITGATLTAASGSGRNENTNQTVYTGTAQSPSGSCIVVGGFANIGFNETMSAASGWTFVGPYGPASGESDYPLGGLVYQIVASPAGSYTPTVNGSGGGQRFNAACGIVYAGAPPASAPTARAVIF